MIQSTANHDPLIRMVDVHKRFGAVVVLDGINLELNTGETTVMIGESGSGKSVILKHIVRLLKPDRGQVYYRDQRIDDLPERNLVPIRRRFGFLFQHSALFDSMTVADNIAFPIVEHSEKNQSEIEATVAEKLAMVGMSGFQDRWPAELSGGQKKRVALARAIAVDPELILYDEPTTGLDPPRSDEINELIVKLKRELGVTSIVVTHDMASVRKIADRIVMIYKGKFIFDGTPEAVMITDDSRVRRFVEGRCSDEVLETLHGKHKT